MLTVTFDELELNAVLASLDDRLAKMGRQLVALKTQPESFSQAYAIAATEAAIRHAMLAQLNIATALPDDSVGAGAMLDVLTGIEQYQAESR